MTTHTCRPRPRISWRHIYNNTHMPPTHTCPLAAYHKCPNSRPQTHTPRRPNHDSQHCAHAAHARMPSGGVSTNPQIAAHRHAPRSGQTTTRNTTTTPTCHTCPLAARPHVPQWPPTHARPQAAKCGLSHFGYPCTPISAITDDTQLHPMEPSLFTHDAWCGLTITRFAWCDPFHPWYARCGLWLTRTTLYISLPIFLAPLFPLPCNKGILLLLLLLSYL
jgi:hypothetical protein